MRAARETPSTCAVLSQGARPLAQEYFNLTSRDYFLLPIFYHTSMDIEHFVTETINNCVRINPSPEASDML